MLEGEGCCVLVNLQHVPVSDILTPKDNRLEMDDNAYEYDYKIRRLTFGTASLKLENSLCNDLNGASNQSVYCSPDDNLKMPHLDR